MTLNPTTSINSIIINDPTDEVHPYTIPLQLEGVVSYFEYTLPTSAEYEEDNIPNLELMAKNPAWNPNDNDFALHEEHHLDYKCQMVSAARSNGHCGSAEAGMWSADADHREEPHWCFANVAVFCHDQVKVVDGKKMVAFSTRG